MRLNKDTKIIGSNIILVPYKEHHVPRYHAWMQSEEVRILTGSEELSLEEEYKMQQNWLLDEDKCTFIVLDKETFKNTNDEVESMIGDTNFFILDDRLKAEAEIMIAENSQRGKHRGWESMLHMFLYGINYIHLKQFMVKILESNTISINMFLKMGFIQVGPADIFKEVKLEKDVDANWVEWIKSELPIHEVINEELKV